MRTRLDVADLTELLECWRWVRDREELLSLQQSIEKTRERARELKRLRTYKSRLVEKMIRASVELMKEPSRKR